jgi:N6-adenosine-specific RNA methylase IME4
MMTAPEPFTELPAARAGVVLADPPWSFRTYSPRGWGKSAHAKYACMSLAEIMALPVAALCARDSVLILWSTQSHLPQALQVMAAWGFAYKSAGAWAKQAAKDPDKWAFGTGFRWRCACEFFLLGTRGHPPQLSRGERNLIVAPVREHSRKPDQMYDLIEASWPGPYVELFATQSRAGWRAWARKAPPLIIPERNANPC